jgi:hypothetical protein
VIFLKKILAMVIAGAFALALILSSARWLVPKMVKNGLKSSFVFSRLIWSSLVSES